MDIEGRGDLQSAEVGEGGVDNLGEPDFEFEIGDDDAANEEML